MVSEITSGLLKERETAKVLRDNELAKVIVRKEDIDLIVS